MTGPSRASLASLRRTFPPVCRLFLFLGRRAKKTRVFALLALLPVALAVAVRMNQVARGAPAGEGLAIFSSFLMVFYLQFLLVVLTLFFGTSVVTEELEGKTLPYLTTRPLSKPGIVLGKYAAYATIMSVLILVSLFGAFLILAGGRLGDGRAWLAFLRAAGVLVLGVLGYTAFFTLLGAVLKRSIFVGLIFGFGWESVISYFPGSTQRFSIVHYLKSLLPGSSDGRFSLLMFRLEPTRPALAILTLALVTAGALAAAGLVFRWKEYLFED
jgi:ABC-2 type transport system permease protein